VAHPPRPPHPHRVARLTLAGGCRVWRRGWGMALDCLQVAKRLRRSSRPGSAGRLSTRPRSCWGRLYAQVATVGTPSSTRRRRTTRPWHCAGTSTPWLRTSLYAGAKMNLFAAGVPGRSDVSITWGEPYCCGRGCWRELSFGLAAPDRPDRAACASLDTDFEHEVVFVCSATGVAFYWPALLTDDRSLPPLCSPGLCCSCPCRWPKGRGRLAASVLVSRQQAVLLIRTFGRKQGRDLGRWPRIALAVAVRGADSLAVSLRPGHELRRAAEPEALLLRDQQRVLRSRSGAQLGFANRNQRRSVGPGRCDGVLLAECG
jgi:hypothetical protein